jgi:sulfonate transport system substrate-binding protein
MRLRAFVAVVLALGAMLFGPAYGAQAEPLKIRVGWVVAPANLPTIMFEKAELAHHLGKSYVMELVHFRSTNDMVTAMAAGELDIGTLAYSSFALGIENAGLTDLRVIADEFQGGVDGYYSDEYMVLNDSPIKTIGDLKGRILSNNAQGSAGDMAIRAMVRKHHIDDRKDVSWVYAGMPNMTAFLEEKKADLVAETIPFSLDPHLRSEAHALFTQRQALGETQMILWAARAGWIAKNRPALVDFFEDVIRERAFLTDPANHKEAVEIAARVAKEPPAAFDSWLFTKKDYYRDPRDLPNLDALQRNMKVQTDLGYTKATPDAHKYADLSLVKEAYARLK